MNQFIEGFLLQASLILALGAQNLFVLESGLKKERHLLVALICSICDAVLIAVGVAGAASIFIQVPILKLIFGALGVLFLIYFGAKKIKESFQKSIDKHEKIAISKSLSKIMFLSLSFSLLNPHVYLDTVILIGGYSAKFHELQNRIIFGMGAASFSIIWFFGLSLFAYYLSPFLNNPKMMKKIELISGLILLGLSWKLGYEVYHWTTL